MRKILMTLFGVDVTILDIVFMLGFAVFFAWSVVASHNQVSLLRTISNNTAAIPPAIQSHDRRQLLQHGIIEGELKAIENQNNQFIEYLKKEQK